jgi:hypothetical protein
MIMMYWLFLAIMQIPVATPKNTAVPPATQSVAILKTPIPANITYYYVLGFSYRLGDYPQIIINYSDNLNNMSSDVHNATSDPETVSMIDKVRKGNFATKSLDQVLLEHLIAEGKIPPATIGPVPPAKK